MNVVNDDFSTDFKSTPVKVHLPDQLVNQVNEFCEATGRSKSELIRSFLTAGLHNTVEWSNKRFFFPNRVVDNAVQIRAFFQNAPINTLVKIAANHVNNPSSAYLVIGYFQSISEDKISIYIPPFNIFHPSLNNAPQQLLQISTSDSKLVFPESQNTLNAWNQIETRLIYSVPIDYIWECNL